MKKSLNVECSIITHLKVVTLYRFILTLYYMYTPRLMHTFEVGLWTKMWDEGRHRRASHAFHKTMIRGAGVRR